MSACEDLTKLFKTTVEDGEFFTYEPYLKKLAVEPNAVAQEAGLAALVEYVSNAPNASRYISIYHQVIIILNLHLVHVKLLYLPLLKNVWEQPK